MIDETAKAFVVEINWTRNTWEEICVFRDKAAAKRSCQELIGQTYRIYGHAPYRVREINVNPNIVI